MGSFSILDVNSLVNKILEYKPSDHLINFVPPEELEREMEEMLVEFPFKSCVEIPEDTNSNSNSNNKNGSNDLQIIKQTELGETIQILLEKCVNTANPMFVSQMYGGVNPIGLLGAIVVEKMNTNQHTYEAAPVFVIAERVMLRQLRKLFYGTEAGDGIFAPGGSIANLYGLLVARNELLPEIKKTGLAGVQPLVVFASEEAHYSISKMGNLIGIGLDNVIKVKTAKNGSMIIADLEAEISKAKTAGKLPFVIVATAGTTVLGAFDPIEELVPICQKEKIWLHCDASWGGAFIFSEKLRNQWLQGIEKCDSICWNAHKMLGTPLQCSIFITKHVNVLSRCNSIAAPYLFQPDKHYSSSYDESGEKSIQCGRKADAFKLWLMWRVMGRKGFQSAVENTENCARYFTEQIKCRDGFLMFLETYQCTNIFFWYIPPELRNCEKNEGWWNKVAEVTRKIKGVLLLSNQLMIGYSPLPNKNAPDAFRLVLSAYPPPTFKDMDKIIEMIENVGSTILSTVVMKK